LDHDIGLDDHESLEQFLTGSLQSSDLGKTNPNGKNKIIHSVKVIHHDGDSITKYVTTSHTDPDADDDLFGGVLMPSRQPSNTPGAYTKIMKKTIIKQSNSDENSFKEPSSVTQNIYSKNNSKEIETGSSVSKSQATSQIDHMTNNSMPLTSTRPITSSPDNLQNGMRTTITKIITSGNTANDLSGYANNLDSKSSNKAISTMSSSNSNHNDMVTDFSQIKPLGGDVKIQTTTTKTINGFTDGDNQGEFRKRPEDGSFRRTTTTIVKQQNSNGRDNNFGELDERDIEYVKGNTRPSKDTVYQITPSGYNQLTTTSTTNIIDRNTPSNDGISIMRSSNSNSSEHNIEFDKGNTRPSKDTVYQITPSGYNQLTTTITTNTIGRNTSSNDGISTQNSSNSNSNEDNIAFNKGNMRFSENILSQTNPSNLTTTSITNAVDEKSTNGDNFFAGDLSGKPNIRLDKSMSLGNSVYGYGISSQMHSDEIAVPSTDMKKNSNNADSFRQTQTKLMGYRGTSDESHAGGSNDYMIKFNTDNEMSYLNNNANSSYMGSSNNTNSMVANPSMMAMNDNGVMSGGYSSSMASTGNNMKGNGYCARRKRYNRRKFGKRGKKDKTRNKCKRSNKITVKSTSYEIGGGRRGIARKNKNAKFYKSQDYVQMTPKSWSFSESYTVNPTKQQQRRLQCSCENTNMLHKRYDDNSQTDERNLSDNKMNDAQMQELFNQISFGPPGPPPYGRSLPRGRPQPRGPPPHGRPPHGRPPHGRPPWFRRPPPGPQQNEFISMNRPPGLLPGQSPTYSQPDRATILNGQTQTMYGQQNKFPNHISNVLQSQYLGPPNQLGPLEPPSPSGLPGPQFNSFDSIQAYESNPILYQQSSDRYQMQPTYTSSSYQEHNDIIDGAHGDFDHVYDEAVVSPSPSEHTSTQSEPGKRVNVNSVGFTQTQWNRDNGNIGFDQTGTPTRSVSMTTSTAPSDNVISNANNNRRNAVYTKTVKTTKKISGNNPPDIDVVQTVSKYTY